MRKEKNREGGAVRCQREDRDPTQVKPQPVFSNQITTVDLFTSFCINDYNVRRACSDLVHETLFS